MRKVDAKELSRIVNRTKNIRNICIVGHVGQGKTSVSSCMLKYAQKNEDESDGQASRTQGNDNDDDMSIYDDDGDGNDNDEDKLTTCSSVIFKVKEEDQSLITDSDESSRDFLITIIDPTGHVDNDSEVTSALRVTDGCIVIVDCVTGVKNTTEVLMRHAFTDHTCPVLLLNRIDLSISKLELEPEQLYDVLVRGIWTYNKIVEIYGKPMYQVDPCKGSVAFGAAGHDWAFTLHEFARMYHAKFKIEFSEIKEKLWGDNFFNHREKKWSTTPGPRSPSRGFVEFILTPIYKVFNVCKYQDRDTIIEFAAALDFPLTTAEKQARRDDLRKLIMSKWLPAGKSFLNMVVFHLPSPVTVQVNKTEILYEGDITDQAAKGMKLCDPEGGLMMYVTRHVPSLDEDKLYAFGRIFSGKVSRGQRVCIRGPAHYAGDRSRDYEDGTIHSVYVFYNGEPVEIDTIPCGNICGLMGVEKHIVKTATVTTMPRAETIKSMTFTVKNVVSMSVEPKNPKDLHHVMEGLKQLQRRDARLELEMTKVGELYIWGVNELHVTGSMIRLRENLRNVQVKTKGPFLSYRETVVSESTDMCRVKTPNNKNTLCMDCAALPEGCIDDIETERVAPFQDMKERALYLDSKYKIDLTFAKKIWCFGPDGNGPNMLMNCIKGDIPKSIQDVEPTFIAGFQWATKRGVLCEEQVRGVRYNLHELVLDKDPEMWSNKEMFPTIIRLYKSAFLSARPRLMQPLFKVEIQCPESVSPDVFEVITTHHGRVTKEHSVKDWDTYYVEAQLPVEKAFGFEKELKTATDSAATMTQCVFDQWERLPGSPLDNRSKIYAIIRKIRKRKGLSPDVPTMDDFL